MQTSARQALGAAATVVACIFPFAAGPSPTAQPHLFALGALACSTALFGFHRINRLVVVLAACALAILLARSGTYPSISVAAAASVVLAVLSFHTGAKLGRERAASDFLVAAVVIAALINGIEGLLQYFGLAGGLWPWVPESLARGVAVGVFGQTNLFAGFLCCGLICTAWLLHNGRISPSMAWFFAALLALGIAASASRIGSVCIVALAVGGYVWRRDQSQAVTRLLMGNVLLYAGSSVLMPWLAQLHGFEARGVGTRLLGVGTDTRWALWQNSIDMLRVHPWAGWGWGEFAYAHYITPHQHRFEPGQLVGNAHNLVLHLAVELGLPIALLLASLMLFAVVRCKPWAAAKKGHQFAWGLLLVIGIHSLFEFPLWSPHNVFLAAFAAGFLAPAGSAPVQRDAVGLRLGAIVLVLLTVAAWVQYRKLIALAEVPPREIQARQRAMDAAADAWMFAGHVDFARFSAMVKSQADPADIRRVAERLLHFSAEPAVIEPLLSASWNLGERSAFDFHAERYCQAFPVQYARWRVARSPERDEARHREPSTICHVPN